MADVLMDELMGSGIQFHTYQILHNIYIHHIKIQKYIRAS